MMLQHSLLSHPPQTLDQQLSTPQLTSSHHGDPTISLEHHHSD